MQHPVLDEHLRRTRARIAQPLGPLAHRYGALNSRYVGSAKDRLGSGLANLNPIGRPSLL